MFPKHMFATESLEVSSGVADQPMTDAETLTGALNRVQQAYAAQPAADFWIGIEGGVTLIENELAAFAWVVVKSKDLLGKARSGTFFLPPAVKELIDQGVELGTADDMVFGQVNSKQKGGAVGILTGDVMDRKELYEQAVVLALIPFKNSLLFSRQQKDSVL